MFKNLTDFSHKRSPKEAFGFYLAYLVLIIIFASIGGGLLGLFVAVDSFSLGVRFGTAVAIIFSLSISFWILKEKKLLNSFGLILIALLSGLLAVIAGAIGGLIPAAYLTTKAIRQTDS